MKMNIFRFDKTGLGLQKIKKRYVILSTIGVVGIAFSIGFVVGYRAPIISNKNFSDEEKIMILKEGDKFTKEKFIKYINELNLKFPEIVYAQAKLESGFNSKIFKENNNLFGMKCANIRPTTNVGMNDNHAVFNNWRESVQDYGFYQAYCLSDIKTKDYYYSYLEERYSETPGYTDRVKNCEKEYYSIVEKLKEEHNWLGEENAVTEITNKEQKK